MYVPNCKILEFLIVNSFNCLFNERSCKGYIIFFIKSLKLKFQNLNITTVTFLSSIIFLSPTLRSLAAWPYPLLYAICFFQISIFYFLKFHKGTKTKRLKYCLLNIFFLALSAYFTPNFAVFSIFFLFYFFKNYKLSKETLLII